MRSCSEPAFSPRNSKPKTSRLQNFSSSARRSPRANSCRCSSLSDEDKARGQLAFGRLARGAVDEKLVDDDFEHVVAPLGKSGQYRVTVDGESKSGFSMRSPQQVTNEDLLLVIERAEKLAEEKELSPEPLNVDIVEELDRIVEETLGRKIVPPGKD